MVTAPKALATNNAKIKIPPSSNETHIILIDNSI